MTKASLKTHHEGFSQSQMRTSFVEEQSRETVSTTLNRWLPNTLDVTVKAMGGHLYWFEAVHAIFVGG